MITRAHLDDLAALRDLETACFAEAWSEKALLSLLENPAYLVLLDRDERRVARGYLIGWQVGEEAELARLGVSPAVRGEGIGAALVEYALPIWRTAGVQTVFLEVRESNQIARRLYASRKFAEIGLRSGYYADGENALVLRLEFENLAF